MIPPAQRRPSTAEETRTANRGWWDDEAVAYLDEHGEFLGDADLTWCPEGLREADARLLGAPGSLAGRTVLEIGCGAAQCSRFLIAEGAQAVACDLSLGMLRQARLLDRRAAIPPAALPLVQADGGALPFADESFEVVFTAYGVIPFVADSAQVMREVCRVLRPGGRFVFSTSHPFRWCFLDDPGPAGLTATFSYFDETPYVEVDPAGRAGYVEHHRTLGHRVRELVQAGLRVVDIVEPAWEPDNQQEWGGWSPARGELFPGTVIFVADKPAAP